MIKTLAEGFGYGVSKNLVSGLSEGRRRTSISSKSSKIAQKLLRRVLPQELENSYYADPITFNSVNKSVQMIMSAGYKFDLDESDKKNFNEFIENLGQVGEDYTIDELIEFIFWSEIIFGYSWIENVYNEDMTDIVDLTRIDPKQMDYARDSEGNVLLDSVQKPIGYIQTIGNYMVSRNIENIGDKVPKEYLSRIDKSDNQIFLKL